MVSSKSIIIFPSPLKFIVMNAGSDSEQHYSDEENREVSIVISWNCLAYVTLFYFMFPYCRTEMTAVSVMMMDLSKLNYQNMLAHTVDYLISHV